MRARLRRAATDRVLRLPLRTRLVALLTVLVAAALLVAGAAAVAALRGYLLGEVDRSITQTATRLAAPVDPFRVPPDPGGIPPSGPGPLGQEATYVSVSDATGTDQASAASAAILDPPVLPSLDAAAVRALEGEGYVVDSVSGTTRWRAVTLPLADGSGSVTVAQDVGGIDATVARLVSIEVAIGAAVLLVLGVAGWVLVRRSLRPLAGVEQAAAAIAAGDLSRRAEAADPRTEIGSLAQSFNTMVDALEAAFCAQRASELAARESAALARASEGRMRQFVADASHELRTPLTSVRGFAELYRIGAVAAGDPLDDAMARIEAEAGRMGVLVEDLLLLARLDRARPLEVGPVDVVDLVADAIAAARAGAPLREIHLAGADAVGASVPGDGVRLRQVVDNLLSNAIRYSPADRPVRVRARWHAGDPGDPGDWCALEVADEGPGMPPEVAARVFERFYREDAARSRGEGGSGLGLAIVAAIVAAHGGRVGVRTEVGAGATFTVLLPRAVVPAVLAGQP